MANHLQPGAEVRSGQNTYIIRSVLGSGGFGITYSATYATKINGMRVKVVVALKEFFLSSDCEREESTGSMSISTPGRERTERAKKDFIGEARRLQALSGGHRNVISVSEVFEANNTAYYVMEYVEGESLDAYVKANGAIGEAKTLEVMRPIVDAVAFLHRNRITHLDIKPSNIMLCPDEDGGVRPVLIDFGLSKHYNEDGSATSTINSMGYSDGYSPIEQYAGINEFSPASDVYSLGATLLYCLTGRRPDRAVDIDIEAVCTELRSKGVNEPTVLALQSALKLKAVNRPADASKLYTLLGSEKTRQLGEGEKTRLMGKGEKTVLNPKRVDLGKTKMEVAKDETTEFTAMDYEKEYEEIDDEPRKSRRWLWISLVVILLAGAGVAVYMYMQNSNKVVGLDPYKTYEFTSEDSNGHHFKHKLIGKGNWLWCIETVDGYYLPISFGNSVAVNGNTGFVEVIRINPNLEIGMKDGFFINIGDEEPNGISATLSEVNNKLRRNIFNGDDYITIIRESTRIIDGKSELAGMEWIVKTKGKGFEKSTVSEKYSFGYDGHVTIVKDYGRGHVVKSVQPYIEYRHDGKTLVCFMGGDSPNRDAIAGYVDGDVMHLHRTGIVQCEGKEFILKRQKYEEQPAPAAEAPAAIPAGA